MFALLASRVRPEERLLLNAYAARGVEPRRLDPRRFSLRTDRAESADLLDGIEVVHDREISFGTAVHASEVLEAAGCTVVNRSSVIRTAGDKLRTSLALSRAGVPQPESRVAWSADEALRLLDEELRYPAVLKPVVGSWSRLVARLNDRHAAEAVLEDRAVLGNWTHGTLFLQALVRKPGRDLRVFVVGDEPIAAIYRSSEHWITNTARGATTSVAPVDGEVGELALRAAQAVGGGMLAVDLVEDPERGLLVLEVNHSMEFRNSVDVTGVDIPGAMVDYVLRLGSRARALEAAR